jgi:hypothetical protein
MPLVSWVPIIDPGTLYSPESVLSRVSDALHASMTCPEVSQYIVFSQSQSNEDRW